MIEISVRCEQGDFRLEADIIAKGRILALCGVSGAGKSTLLNIIAGLVRPSAGRIAVDGAVLLDSAAGIDLPPRARGVGYVFQDLRLFPHLSVAKNLRYSQRFRRAGARHVDFSLVTNLLGVSALLERRPDSLSGGEKQRVAIGRALLASPRILLLDEPLTSLDDQRRHEILALIEKLRDAFAIPIVFVSHRLSEVDRLASDIAVLDAGRVVAVRRPLLPPNA